MPKGYVNILRSVASINADNRRKQEEERKKKKVTGSSNAEKSVNNIAPAATRSGGGRVGAVFKDSGQQSIGGNSTYFENEKSASERLKDRTTPSQQDYGVRGDRVLPSGYQSGSKIRNKSREGAGKRRTYTNSDGSIGTYYVRNNSGNGSLTAPYSYSAAESGTWQQRRNSPIAKRLAQKSGVDTTSRYMKQETANTVKYDDGRRTEYFEVQGEGSNARLVSVSEERYLQRQQLDGGVNPSTMTPYNRLRGAAEHGIKNAVHGLKSTVGSIKANTNEQERARDYAATHKDGNNLNRHRDMLMNSYGAAAATRSGNDVKANEYIKQEALDDMMNERRQLEEQQRLDQMYQTYKLGASKPMQFAMDVVDTTANMVPGMVSNAVLPGSFIPEMAVQAYGNSYNQARNNGATRDEAIRSGIMNAAVESLSESLFAGGRAFGRATGVSGIFHPGREIEQATLGFIKSTAGKDTIRAVQKLGLAGSEEGAEEIVAGLAEPVLDALIYQGGIDTLKDPEFWTSTVRDALYNGLVGFASGGGFGAIDVVQSIREGSDIRAHADVANMINRALSMPEDSRAYSLARSLDNQIRAGQDLGNLDVSDLSQAMQEQQAEISKKVDKKQKNTEQVMARKNIGHRAEAAETSYDRSVRSEEMREEAIRSGVDETEANEARIEMSAQGEEYGRHYQIAKSALADRLMPAMAEEANEDPDVVESVRRSAEEQAESGARTIARVMMGEATDADYLQFTTINPAVREAYQQITGKQIPTSNEAAIDFMINENEDHYVAEQTTEQGRQMLREAADFFGEESPEYKAFENAMGDLSNMDPNLLSGAVRGFSDAYSLGRASAIDDVLPARTPAMEFLTDRQIQKAFEAGKKERDTYLKNKRFNLNRAKKAAATRAKNAAYKRGGNFSMESLDDADAKKVSDGVKTFFKKTAERYSVNIVIEPNAKFVRGSKVSNGFYDPKTNTIHLNVDMKNNGQVSGFIPTFSHEFTHFLEEMAPEEYQMLHDFVVRTVNAKNPDRWEAEIQERMHRYGKGFMRAEAEREVIADMAQEIFADEKTISEFFGYDKTVAQKVMDAITKIVNDFIKFVKGTGESQFLKQIGAWEEYRDMWLRAAEAAKENGGLRVGDDVRNQINSTFASEIDAWDKGGRKGRYPFTLGTTSEPLKSIGMDDYDIKFRVNKLKKILNDHPEISIETIKRIPEILEKPVLVFQSSTVPNSIVVFGDIAAENGLPVLVSLQLRDQHTGEILDFGVVTSTYTKHPDDDLYKDMTQNFIDNNILRYVDPDKKRTADWQVAFGLQLPLGSGQSGSISKIAFYKPPVKSKDTSIADALAKAQAKKDAEENRRDQLQDSTGRQLTPGQQEYFRNSKVRDDQGRLKVMYHGTENAGFTVFRSDYGNSSPYFFFTDRLEGAKGYSGTSRVLDLKAVSSIDDVNDFIKMTGEENSFSAWRDGNEYVIDEDGEELFRSDDPAALVNEYNEYIGWGGEHANYEVYLDVTNPLVVDAKGQDWENIDFQGDTVTSNWLADYAASNGYDGLIIENVYDYGLYNSQREVAPQTDVVVFNANQIKSVTNENPTDDPDIRFQMQSPVEQKGDLIAVHNLNEEDLMNTIRLGGFPMPSIAVTRTNMGHSKYGTITLLFNKDTIDPKKSKTNEIFGGDAYTPTFPSVDRKINDQVVMRVRKRIEDILGADIYNLPFGLKDPGLDSINAADKLQYREPFDAYGDSDVFKIAYLQSEKGFDVAIPMKEGDLKGHDRDFWELIEDHMPAFTINDIYSGSMSDVMERYEPAVRNAMKAYYKAKYSGNDAKLGIQKALLAKYDKPIEYSEVLRIAEGVAAFREYGIKQVIDQDALSKILDERVDEEGYRKWIDGLFEGIIEKEGIRNNKDPYTPSGNRRSWEALHDPVTLENVVKSMKQQLSAGANGLFGSNPKGAAQKKYGSISEVRADKDRLRMLSDEEFGQLESEATDKLSNVCASIASHNQGKYYNPFGSILDTGEYIAEILNRTRDKASIKRSLEKDYNLEVTDEEMDDLMEAIDAIANLPTGYFEAKPRRAVGLDEIRAAVIPDTASAELKDALDQNGIEYIEYKEGDEEERKAKVNEAAEEKDLRFQFADDAFIDKDSTGKPLAVITTDIFEGKTGKRKVIVTDYLKDNIGSRFRVAEDGHYIYVGAKADAAKSRRDLLPNKYQRGKSWQRLGRALRYAKQRGAAGIGRMIEIASFNEWTNRTDPQNPDKHKSDAKYGFNHYGTRFAFYDSETEKYAIFDVDLLTRLDEDGEEYVYDVQGIKEDATAVYPANGEKAGQETGTNSDVSNESIAEEGGEIKRQLQSDRDREIADLQSKVERLQRDKRRTYGREASDADATRVARALLADTSSDFSLNQTIKAVKELFTMIKRGDDFADIYGYVQGIARSVADSSYDMVEIPGASDLADLRQRFLDARKSQGGSPLKILIPQNLIGDFDRVGGWKEFRAAHKGIVTLSVNSGESYDSFIEGIADEFGEQFNVEGDNSGIDTLIAIIEAADSKEARSPVRKAYKDEDVEGAMPDDVDMGIMGGYRDTEVNEIIDRLLDDVADQIAPDLTFADKKAAEKDAAVKKERAKWEARREQWRKDRDKRIAEMKEDKKLAVEAQRAKGKERLQKQAELYRRQREKARERRADTASRRKTLDRIYKTTQRLSQKLLKPTDSQHIPEKYRKAVADMLGWLDFENARTDQWAKRHGNVPSARILNMRKLQEVYAKIAEDEQLNQYIEPDDQIYEWLEYLSDIEGSRLDDLTTEQLRTVRLVLDAVSWQVNNADKALTEGLKQSRADMATELMDELEAQKGEKLSDSTFKKLIKADSTPVHFFERLGLNVFKKLYQQLTLAQDTHIKHLSEAQEYIEKNITSKWGNTAKIGNNSLIKKWTEEANKYKLENGKTVEMTGAQVMSLYALNKREQARKHLLGGGIVIAPTKVKRDLKGGIKEYMLERQLQKTRAELTYTDITNILNQMSKDQIDAAEAMLKYLKTTSEWGNETSMKLYGYRKFTEDNYFPIQSAKEFIAGSNLELQRDKKIKNQGMTKNVNEYANNPIVIDDFFEVTTAHINQMSQYNSFVPILEDFDRVYQYSEYDPETQKYHRSVKELIEQKHGRWAADYIENLLKNVNGNFGNEVADIQGFEKLLRNWKAAKIGLSIRVFAQQPTAVVRAFNEIDPKYFVGTPRRGSHKRMWEICPIAEWKHWGYSQTDIHRSMRDTMMGDKHLSDKLFFDMYGKADDLGWGAIFDAVERETKDLMKKGKLKFEYDSAEYRQHVNERFRHIVDRTQVVDSVLHRSQYMRSQNTLTKAMTAFMAEPTISVNTIMTAFTKAQEEARAGHKAAAAKAAGKGVSVFVANAVAVSLMASLISAIRESYLPDDDDDEEKELTKLQQILVDHGFEEGSFLYDWISGYFIEDFKDNINPLMMIPVAKDMLNMWQGYEAPNPMYQLPQSLIQTTQNMKKWIDEDGDTRYSGRYYIERAAESVAELFGVPAANIRKELIGIQNIYFRAISEKEYGDYLQDRWELNEDYKSNKNIFIDHYLNAKKAGHDESAKDIREQLLKSKVKDDDGNPVFTDEAIQKRAWSVYAPNFKDDVIAGRDVSKQEKDLKSVGITEEDIEDTKGKALVSSINDAVEMGDTNRIEDLYGVLEKYGYGEYDVDKKVKSAASSLMYDAIDAEDYSDAENYINVITDVTGYTRDDVVDSITTHYMSDYWDANDSRDTASVNRILSILDRYGVSRATVKEKETEHYKDYYRQKAYMAYANGDTAEAYRIATEYSRRYPDGYVKGADGMMDGLTKLQPNTINKYKTSTKYSEWEIPW